MAGTSGDVARLKNIHFSVVEASAQRPDARAAGIATLNSTAHWGTNSNAGQYVILEMEQPCLLGFIRVWNRSTSQLSASIALVNTRSQFIRVRRGHTIPHHKATTVRTGYMPARFVRIDCQAGTPCSINSVQVMGVPMQTANLSFGESLRAMLVDHPVRSLFNPVVPEASDGDVVEGIAALERRRRARLHRGGTPAEQFAHRQLQRPLRWWLDRRSS